MLVQRINVLPRVVINNESELQLNLHSSGFFSQQWSEIPLHTYTENKKGIFVEVFLKEIITWPE